MIEIVRNTQRNVKRWSWGEMGLRWTAAGMLEAERQFRRIIGYRDLAKLAVAVERELAADRSTTPVAARMDGPSGEAMMARVPDQCAASRPGAAPTMLRVNVPHRRRG